MPMYRVEQLRIDINLSEQLVAAERISQAIESLADSIVGLSETLNVAMERSEAVLKENLGRIADVLRE